MSDYAVARLDEMETIDDGRCAFQPVRHHFGITAFGVNSFTGKAAGDRIINEHDEAGENEELYVVLTGHARFELDGSSVDAPAGTFVFAKPGVKRTAFAEEPNTTLVAVGATPGEAYEPHGWELWGPLHALYADGKYEEVIAQGRAKIEANPQYPGPYYNLACCEALAGHTDDAIEHLRHAIGGSEQFRKLAREDSDFESLRGEPAFQELVAEA